jgi:hypothetical protein
MQVTVVIPWIFNLVMLPKELVLQPHTRGVSKSINIPVIMKIWLRKIIPVNSSILSNSIRFIFFISDLDVLNIILAVVALTTFKHLTINQDQENIWLIKHK